MLTLYRSNWAEFLAAVLARQLLEAPPGPLETVEVMVNTWPTSRWLGEQLAQANGISSLVRFPFPGSRLRQLVRRVLELPEQEPDPWRATTLVWSVLELLPALLEQPEASPLRQWLQKRDAHTSELCRDRWQLARAIADVFDDYALYRPETLERWWHDAPHHADADWQPLLFQQLAQRLPSQPFGLQVRAAIERLRKGEVDPARLPEVIRLFGISALAPVQVDLIQALSGCTEVQIYLLTPCPDLWQRCGRRREELGLQWIEPPDGAWLRRAPRLEATLGRMGAEFQQLLEGSGESQLGEVRDGDLFADPLVIATADGRPPTLLEQLQHQLVAPDQQTALERPAGDSSLLFQAAPGPWREVQLVRDRILQWLAADPDLEPRDVLVMTPQIERYAPLLSSVFNDRATTGVDLPWRLTDRTQQNSPGLTMAVLELLDLAAGRLTASGLERLLSNPSLQKQQAISSDEAAALTRCLQHTGFRWGLNAQDRGGDPTHSLCWCLDRWLLGLVLPQRNGIVAGDVAPFHEDLDPERLVPWWTLLNRCVRWLQVLRQPCRSVDWVNRLQGLIEDWFGDGGDWSWERQAWSAALDDWLQRAADCPLAMDVAVVTDVLREALSVDSGRFGHRSGSLTVSALEPMRAIPHKVIVLMGLDGQDFPRRNNRPGFHLLEQNRLLGDPRAADQDRYALLEALMSARRHLLISWCGRNEHTGEHQPPSAPVQQWLSALEQQLGTAASQGLLMEPPANPLDRRNFQVEDHSEPFSCDGRQLEARRWLDRQRDDSRQDGLAWPMLWRPSVVDSAGEDRVAGEDRAAGGSTPSSSPLSLDDLQRWLINPQSAWLRHLGLHTGEGIDAVQDLECLSLDALQRHRLLEQCFDMDQPLVEAPDWLVALAGQGVLPTGAGALLEQRVLLDRWGALQELLDGFGPCRREGALMFAGTHHVVVQPGRLSSHGVMRCWIQHLQLCTADYPFSGSAVIARQDRGDRATVHLRWRVLASRHAAAELEALQTLAQGGLEHCWPVPPRSGWALIWNDHRKAGSGEMHFRKAWLTERDQPPQQLCFGVAADADRLLEAEGFVSACTTLYQPLLAALAG